MTSKLASLAKRTQNQKCERKAAEETPISWRPRN